MIRWGHRRVQGSFALCASRLHTCRACSIPAASLGFYPSEVCSLPEPVAFRQTLPLFSLARVVGQPRSRGFLLAQFLSFAAVASSPWVGAQCLELPCGNPSRGSFAGCWLYLPRSDPRTCIVFFGTIIFFKTIIIQDELFRATQCPRTSTTSLALPVPFPLALSCGWNIRPRFRALEFRGWSPGCARGLGAAFNRLPGLAPLLGFPPFRV